MSHINYSEGGYCSCGISSSDCRVIKYHDNYEKEHGKLAPFFKCLKYSDPITGEWFYALDENDAVEMLTLMQNKYHKLIGKNILDLTSK